MNLKKYEIVFVTREGKNLPGARYRAYNWVKELNRLGYRAFVLSYHDTLGAFDGKLERFLSLWDKISYNKRAYNFIKRNFNNPLLIIQRFNYHSIAPLLFAFYRRLPFVLDLDDWEFKENLIYYSKCLSNSKAETILRIIARKALACLAGSSYLCNYLKKITPNTFYLPPAVDLEMFSKKKIYSSNEVVRLAWVGTLFREEDVENLKFLFEVLNEIKEENWVLEIIGDGIFKEAIISEVKKYKLKKVIFKGWISPMEIPNYMEKIDVGLFPIAVKNKFMKAKFPVKVIEFMAKGIPVLASSFGEVERIIINEKTGFLAKDKSEFLEKLLVLINDRNLRMEMGNAAYEHVSKNYDLEKRIFAFIKIIENASN